MKRSLYDWLFDKRIIYSNWPLLYLTFFSSKLGSSCFALALNLSLWTWSFFVVLIYSSLKMAAVFLQILVGPQLECRAVTHSRKHKSVRYETDQWIGSQSLPIGLPALLSALKIFYVQPERYIFDTMVSLNWIKVLFTDIQKCQFGSALPRWHFSINSDRSSEKFSIYSRGMPKKKICRNGTSWG